MKRLAALMLILSLFATGIVACGRSAPAAPTAAPPDVQATVKAAIAATAAVPPTADVQATVDAAVAATAAVTPTPDVAATVDAAVAATAQTEADVEATVEAAVEATVAAAPTAIPSEQYVTMTDEELAAVIDEAVAEAVAATEQASASATEATADDDVTQEEVIVVETYVQYADETIAYAEELIDAYYDLYAELATETIAVLQEVETDLDAMAANTAAINDSLQEINSTLEQGLTLADETINQLETAAQAAATKAAETKSQAEVWVKDAQTDRENRVQQVLSVQPNLIPEDAQAALWGAFDFADGVRLALGDGKISKSELMDVAQLGANASAGLQGHGGPNLQPLSGSVNDITGKLARGQVPQAESSLGSFESSLGARPAGRPSAPSIPSGHSMPSGPSRPSGGGGRSGNSQPPSRR